MGFVPGKRLLLSFMTMLMTFSWRFLVILARRAQCAGGLRRSDKAPHTGVGLVERVGPECGAHKEIYAYLFSRGFQGACKAPWRGAGRPRLSPSPRRRRRRKRKET